MALMRNVLLQGSRSRWLAGRARRYRFVRRAVSRFLPGETVNDALAASRVLQAAGIGALLTRLSEDVTSEAEAERPADLFFVVQHLVVR